MNSKDKGKRYERELAGQLRAYGYDARRGQQFSGANGDPDVIGLPGIHIEAKHRERGHGEIYDWMAQSISDARDGEIPTVWHRKNHCETLVTMRMPDFMELYRENEPVGNSEQLRPKGKWHVYEVANTEEEQPIAWECSECGEVVEVQYNFCPNCGADMRGEEDD